MIILNKTDLLNARTCLPIDYASYFAYLSGDGAQNSLYQRIAVTHSGLVLPPFASPPQDSSLMIFNQDDMIFRPPILDFLMHVFHNLAIDSLLVQQATGDFPWYPECDTNTNQQLASRVISYLASNIKSNDYRQFNGGFILSATESIEFSSAFINYPYSFGFNQDIDIISASVNLVIKITHHATVDFISNDKKILNETIKTINKLHCTRKQSIQNTPSDMPH